MRRCPECGSWEVQCDSDSPVPNCGCKRCLSARLDAMTARAAKSEAELSELKAPGKIASQLKAVRDVLGVPDTLSRPLHLYVADLLASRERLAAELRILLNGNVCDQYEKWAKGRIRIALRQGGYLEEPNAKA